MISWTNKLKINHNYNKEVDFIELSYEGMNTDGKYDKTKKTMPNESSLSYNMIYSQALGFIKCLCTLDMKKFHLKHELRL